MTRMTAEDDAKKAAEFARSAANNTEDEALADLAQAVHYLAKAVQEGIRQDRMDS